MAADPKGRVRPEIRLHDLAAHKRLEREGGQHIQPEAKPRDINHDVVCGEVIEDIPEGGGAECEEAGGGEEETHDEGYCSRVVGYGCEAVEGGGAERAVD